MDNAKRKELSIIATNIRKDIVTEVYSNKSGHPGGSLSIADVLAYLYFEEMNVDPKHPDCPNRDRFVLSKGHCAPGLYAALAEKGYFPKDDLTGFRKFGSYLQGHPSIKDTPGVDMSSGSLGQGISVACGMAKSAKMFGDEYRVYTIIGDGEMEEGQVWEAAMFAAHYQLDNLCALVDLNGLQIDGKTADVMSPYPVKEKFESFGWHVIEIDGHDLAQIEAAYTEARQTKGMPTMIVSHSVKGKGVSYMENQASWHGAAPNEEQYNQAMAELEATLAKWEVE